MVTYLNCIFGGSLSSSLASLFHSSGCHLGLLLVAFLHTLGVLGWSWDVSGTKVGFFIISNGF